MKKIILAISLTALLVPASAQAYSIHSFKIRDVGPEIRAEIKVCTSEPARFHFNVHIEHESGGDKQNHRFWSDVYSGCTTVGNHIRDNLKWSGRYYAKQRVRMAGTTFLRYTGWRTFYSQ